MSVYQIVFSPTGGTQKVSSIFTKSFSQTTKSLIFAVMRLLFPVVPLRSKISVLCLSPPMAGEFQRLQCHGCARSKATRPGQFYW